MTAADLARLYHVSPRTIWRWAHDDHWQPRARGKWNPADADKSWRKRHTRPSGITALATRLDNVT